MKEKSLIEERATKSNTAITRFSSNNNSYSKEIKLRTIALRKKLRHKEAMRRYRKVHPNFDRNYYLAHRKLEHCEHVGVVQISHNYDSVVLVCGKCGTIISKTGF